MAVNKPTTPVIDEGRKAEMEGAAQNWDGVLRGLAEAAFSDEAATTDDPTLSHNTEIKNKQKDHNYGVKSLDDGDNDMSLSHGRRAGGNVTAGSGIGAESPKKKAERKMFEMVLHDTLYHNFMDQLATITDPAERVEFIMQSIRNLKIQLGLDPDAPTDWEQIAQDKGFNSVEEMRNEYLNPDGSLKDEYKDNDMAFLFWQEQVLLKQEAKKLLDAQAELAGERDGLNSQLRHFQALREKLGAAAQGETHEQQQRTIILIMNDPAFKGIEFDLNGDGEVEMTEVQQVLDENIKNTEEVVEEIEQEMTENEEVLAEVREQEVSEFFDGPDNNSRAELEAEVIAPEAMDLGF